MFNKGIGLVKKNIDFIKNTGSIFFSRVIVLLLSFIGSILISRYYLPDEKGVYSLVTTVSGTCVQILYLGLPTAYTYYLSKGEATRDDVIGNSIVQSFLSIFPCIIAFFIIHSFSNIQTLTNVELLISFISVPFLLLLMYLEQFFLAVENVKAKNIKDITESVLFILSFFWVAALHISNITKFLCITLLTQILVCISFALYTIKKYRITVKVSHSLFNKSFNYAFKSYLSCFLAYLILRIDIYMVDGLLGVYDVGIYSTAVNIVDILSIISSSVGALFLPQAAGISERKDRFEFAKSVMIIVAVVLMFAGTIAEFTAGWFIPYVWGKSYSLSVIPFRILVPGMIFWGIEGIIGVYFASENRFVFPFVSMTIALIANIVLNALFIPRLGIEGASLASTFSYFFAFLAQLLFLRKMKNEISRLCT